MTKVFKVAIIIPFFGSWPNYFKLFLKGCEQNIWLDIIIFTDCLIPENTPSNITFYPSSLKELSLLASKKLNMAVIIGTPYKLCDFKPTYGLIFEDFLTEYDYWGYGDIDLIFGNLQPFVMERFQAGFDVLSGREEIVSGSLSFFRNNDQINHLFMQSAKFVELLLAKEYAGLDETAGDDRVWEGLQKLELPTHSFTYIVAKEQANAKLKASFVSICKEKIENKEIIYYENGELYAEGTPLAYYHFVCNKNDEEYKFPTWDVIPNRFYITTTGFYATRSKIIYRLVDIYRRINGIVRNLTIRIIKRIKSPIVGNRTIAS